MSSVAGVSLKMETAANKSARNADLARWLILSAWIGDMELFDIGGGKAVCSNPGGRFHGWMFFKHPDGQYVSERKLSTVDPYPPDHPLAALLGVPKNEPQRDAG